MQTINNPIEKMYETRPKHWWLYTLIIFAVVIIMFWSATAIEFKGLAAKGSEVAYGIVYGITHPDTNLLYDMSRDGVIYQLAETIAIAILGTLAGAILSVPFSFLASQNLVPKWLALLSMPLSCSFVRFQAWSGLWSGYA